MATGGKFGPAARIAKQLCFRDGLLLIPLAAAAACLPRVRGVSCGDDFDFHLVSWLEVQRSWSQGLLYPHWTQSPNWGAGEPRFIFYPPLSWIFGALLGYVLPWRWVPASLIFLALTAVGITTRALAREFLSGPTATLAGVFAATAPYGLFNAYHRSAFSELVAAAWIPLLLLFAWKQSRPPSQPSRTPEKSIVPRYTVPLALTLAATWLTNAPAGVMASYLLAFVALAAAAVARQWWPVVRSAVAAPLGLGLAAFYLIPAAWEQRWIAIRQALGTGMRVQDSWLFARHADSQFELHDHVLLLASTVLLFTVALAAAALLASWLRRKLAPLPTHIWLPLALLIPSLLLLQLPLSLPLWNLLPKLEFLQFPWRWTTVLLVPYAIFLAVATPLASRTARLRSGIFWSVCLLALLALSTLAFFEFCDEDDKVDNQLTVFRLGTGVEGTDEYAALGSENSLVASNLPDACLVQEPDQPLGETDHGSLPVWYPEQGSCDETYTASLAQTEHKHFQIDADHQGFLILRLRRFPAWRITVNGEPNPSQGTRDDGLIALPIPAGSSTIDIRWHTTADIVWGRGVTGISALLLLAIALAQKRTRPRPAAPRLS